VISLPEHDQQPAEDVGAFAQRCGLELLRFAYLPPPATPSLTGGPPSCGDRQRAEDLLQDVLLAMYRRFPDGAVPAGRRTPADRGTGQLAERAVSPSGSSELPRAPRPSLPSCESVETTDGDSGLAKAISSATGIPITLDYRAQK
jgi:hypothetical protein